MNTDREYCIGLLGVKDGKVVTCDKRHTCKRYIDFKALSDIHTGDSLWLCEPLACRESGYSHYVPLPKD